jgi:hypothetical protein
MCKKIYFKDVLDHNVNLTISEQLKLIIDKIEAVGFKIFKTLIMTLASGFSGVKFFIPDFEQFHLIQTGKRILPNKRGRQLLDVDGEVLAKTSSPSCEILIKFPS